MASAELIQEAASSCQGCSERCPIKGRCIQCNFFMCANCCFLHRIEGLNLQGLHDIVDIEVNTGAHEQTCNTIYCNKHGQCCCFFCNTCEDTACQACVDQIHSQYSIADLMVGLQLSVYKMRSKCSQYENDIIELYRHISNLQSLRMAERSTYEREKQKILIRDTFLKNAVEVHTHRLLQQLDQKWLQLDKSIQDEEKRTETNGRELETRNSNLIRILESRNSNAIFIAAKTELMFKNSNNLKTDFESLPVFLQGNATQLNIESIHGILHGKCDIQQESSKVITFEIKSNENYTTKFSSVNDIVCCSDGSIVINCIKTDDTDIKQLQHLKLFNGKELTNENLFVNCKSIALLPSGELLASTGDSHLHVISRETKTLEKSKYSVKPLKTTEALHIINDGRIIVGATESYAYVGNAKIIVMDLFGEQITTYFLDNNERPLFNDSIPYKVTSDKNNNLYVIDKKGTSKGRVLVIGSGGNIRGIYKGLKSVNVDTFLPTDLAITVSDRVLVCDDLNHMIHIINSLGECIKYQDTKYLGIMQTPLSINVDSRGVLVIGCARSNKEKKDAKIYFVQISEFGRV